METQTQYPSSMRGALVFDGSADASRIVYTNPTQLTLGIGEGDPDRQRVNCLRALCTPDAPAPASDYDLWAALCDLLPCLPGHPLYARTHTLLRIICGWDRPLCAATAAASWRACVAVLNAGTYTVRALAARCGVHFAAAYRPAMDGILPEGVTDLTTMESVLAERASAAPSVLWRLPDDYTFTRPNPYGATQALHAAQKATLTLEMRDHLLSQMLRMTAISCKTAGTCLEICGRAAPLTSLITYLAAGDCLPQTTLWLSDPEDATPDLCPAGSRVSVGLWLDGGEASETMRQKLTAYAFRFPLGIAPGVRMTVRTAADLAGIGDWSAIVRDQLTLWGQTGQGTRDPDMQNAIVTRLVCGDKEIYS